MSDIHYTATSCGRKSCTCTGTNRTTNDTAVDDVDLSPNEREVLAEALALQTHFPLALLSDMEDRGLVALAETIDFDLEELDAAQAAHATDDDLFIDGYFARNELDEAASEGDAHASNAADSDDDLFVDGYFTRNSGLGEADD